MQYYCDNCGSIHDGDSLSVQAIAYSSMVHCEYCPKYRYPLTECYARAYSTNEVAYVVGTLPDGTYYWAMNGYYTGFVLSASDMLTEVQTLRMVQQAASYNSWHQKVGKTNIPPTGGQKVASPRYSGYRNKPGMNVPTTSYGSPATPSIKCTITWDSAAGVYSVSTPYELNFVEFIKAKLPGKERAWDPNTKLWTIEEKWLDVIKQLAVELWTEACVSVTTRASIEDAERVQREAQQQAILQALPERERALYEFLKALPFEAIQAAYTKAAMLLHPDRNVNDGDAMSKLNAAWSKLEKELQKQ